MAILARWVDAVYRTLRQARTFKCRGIASRLICCVLSGIWVILVAQAATAERLLSILPQCAGTGEIVTLTFDTLAQDLPEIRVNGTIAPILSSADPIIRVTVPRASGPANGTVIAVSADGSVSRASLRLKMPEVSDNRDNDCDGFVDEDIQANCEGRECEGIRPGQRVDLSVVSLIHVPEYPVVGEQVRTRVVVANALRTGERDVPELVEVAFYRDGNQRELVSVNIEPGTRIPLDFDWTPVEAGRADVSVIVDPRHLRVERGRGDNQLGQSLTVSDPIAAGVDLAIGAIEFETDGDANTDLVIEIANLTDTALVPDGVSEVIVPLVVTAGGRAFLEQPIKAPPPGMRKKIRLPWPGDRPLTRVQARLGPGQSDLELDPANNNASTDPRSRLDVAVENVSVYRQAPIAGASGRVTISFRIINTGLDAITQPITNRITLGGEATQQHDFETDGLEVGESQYVSHTFKEPAPALTRIEADVGQDITEQTSNNNIFERRMSAVDRGTDSWTSIGPSQITRGLGATGRLMTMAIHPGDPDVIYVASPSGSGGMPGGSGIWKTTDGGETWDPISDALPSLSVRAIALAPSAPDTIVAAADGTGIAGVFRSDDAGATWRQMTSSDLSPRGNAGAKLLIHPSDPDRLYLATTNGLLSSGDGGRNWASVLPLGNVTGLEMDPSNPDRMIAAITNRNMPNAAGLYESFDGGATWSSQALTGCSAGDILPTNVPTHQVVRLARSGSVLYAGYKDHPVGQSCAKYTVYRTTGLGCSVGGVAARVWEEAFSTTNSSTCSQLWSGLYADPNDPDFVYLTGTRFWTSSDGGENFSVQPGPHVDHHTFAVDPSNPRTIYTASDGGLFRSTQRGREGSWKLVSAGITNMEFYDSADADTDPDIVIGGTQDNGNQKFLGDDLVWKSLLSGDGATVDISGLDADVMYAMGQYADSIDRSRNGGNSFPDDFGLPVPPNSCFNLHFHSHPMDPDIFLASCSRSDAPVGGLWRRKDGVWDTVFTPASDAVLRSVVDGADEIYYAATEGGDLFAGVGAENFALVYSSPVAVAVTDLELHPDDRRQIFATFAASGPGRIVRITRGDAPPVTATVVADDITFDLPVGLSVRTIAVDRRNPDTLLAGTNRGVYRGRSSDGGSTWRWTSYGFGLPSGVDISSLNVQKTTGVVRVSTHGRGVYRLNTAPPPGSVVVAEGTLAFLRVHKLDTGFGPPHNFLNTEVVVGLNELPHMAFGFQLRDGDSLDQRRATLDVLREAFSGDNRVSIDYVVTGLTNHRLLRIAVLK